ncbi:Amino Acid-Polyamine-Organocation (APC) Family [Achlya hypogyna]|uniref:Amino Acid-Polyamine-Organocation (APC) Family n=1 Tax=Achlya hypogyna TaxID=1202772 RepID=A0A1V9ZHR3_ACHHY|nr:Amino Acid-Polyamine-Organocation (APC) Family [Achlya hypogyna]
MATQHSSHMEALRAPLTTTTAIQPYKATAFDVWALGITIVIGGQYFSWNAGLVAGVASNAAAIFIVGLAYVCLVLSMAEMTSTLPFAGGAYGLSRCCLGYFSGFVIGCCEALEYIAYVSTSVLMLGEMLQIVLPAITDALLPVAWLVIYVVAVVIHIYGGCFFWLFNRFVALLSTVLLLAYCLGSLPTVSFTSNAGGSDNMFVGGFSSFFTTMPLAAWFFVGVEVLNTVSNLVQNPRDVIPNGQIPCIFTLFACSIFVFFVAVSLPPGAVNLPSVVAVFNSGYMIMFGVSDDVATLLSLPATFATIFGFILAYGNILTALSHSKLLPAWLGIPSKKYHTYPWALIGGSVLGYLLCFAVHYHASFGAELFNICMFFGFSCYIAQCVGYIYLKREFEHLPRRYRSPFGKGGVYFAGVVWIANLVSIVCCQKESAFVCSVVASILGVLTIYYYGYAKHRQTFSDDERQVLFFAHVAKSVSRRSGSQCLTSSSRQSKQA